MQTNSSPHNQSTSIKHTYNQSHSIQSESDSFTLDQSSYTQLIDSLDRLSPFEAVRYAQEINKMNGFEVVGMVEVGRWKREAKKENEKIKTQNEIVNIEFRLPQRTSKIKDFKKYKKENSQNKMSDLQKAYMILQST